VNCKSKFQSSGVRTEVRFTGKSRKGLKEKVPLFIMKLYCRAGGTL